MCEIKKMSQQNIISIIENEVKVLIDDKNILSTHFRKIREELREHLELMGEIDDRQINKISVVNHRDDADPKTLEVWLRDDVFHITEDELRTDDQKKRFALEVERARITEKIVQVNNDFAKTNQQLKRIDPTREFIGMSSWDASSLEAYGKIASLERRLRDWIHEKWYNQNKSYWNDDRFYLLEMKKGIDENFQSLSHGISGIKKSRFLKSKYSDSLLFGEVPFSYEELSQLANQKNIQGRNRTDYLATIAFDEAILNAKLTKNQLSEYRIPT